jgi:ABC-type nitrate/sulfonate/bicarbonate transport system substrate-binding protein
MIVAPNVHGAEDLRNKAVAVSDIGSASEVSMRKVLSILGLRPHKDVTILPIGGQGERMAALEAGYVAGSLVTAPETFQARQRGYRVLVDLGTMNLPDVHTATIVTREFLESDREVVSGFLKATTEAVFRLKNNRTEALQTLSRHLQMDPDIHKSILDDAYDSMVLGHFADLPHPSLAAVQTMIDEIDLSIVQELEQSGFLEELAAQKQ